MENVIYFIIPPPCHSKPFKLMNPWWILAAIVIRCHQHHTDPVLVEVVVRWSTIIRINRIKRTNYIRVHVLTFTAHENCCIFMKKFSHFSPLFSPFSYIKKDNKDFSSLLKKSSSYPLSPIIPS